MLTEAAGLALLAALSPTALLVAAVFLGAANPRRTVLIYLAGAIVMTAVMATVVFVVLRAGHLYKPQERHARYGLRLGLGLLLLLLGAFFLRRGQKPPDPAKAGQKGQGLISRMIARPGPKEAFIVGILVYSPSLTFVAAVQTVATSKDSITESVLALIVVIAITLLCVWVPFVLYLLMPERTGRVLRAFNAWLRTHGRQILVGAMVLGGVVLTIDGILGLTGSS
jgi:threonine/homoserine/homoserine lactone efflux protein